MKVDSKIIVLTVFLILAAFSGFLALNDDNRKVKIFDDPGTQLDEIISNGMPYKEFSGNSGDNIVQKIEIQDISFESQEHWDEFEAIIIDVEKFENAAANGSVNLRLLERDFEVKIEEISRLNGGKLYRYSGYVKEIPQSKATFYVCDELFSGSIEFDDLMYNIAVTSRKYDGKNVHTVFVMDWEKDRGRLKRSLNPLRFIFLSGSVRSFSGIKCCTIGGDSIFEGIEFDKRPFEVPETCEDFEIIMGNPQKLREFTSNGTVNLSPMGRPFELKFKETDEKLDQEFSLELSQFFLKNGDKKTNEVGIEIFDFYDESISYETYLSSLVNKIFSSETSVKPGIYRYELALDRNLTFEQEVRAGCATELGSSEKLHIDLIDRRNILCYPRSSLPEGVRIWRKN